MNPLRKFAFSNRWNIGFVQNNMSEILLSNTKLDIKWMKHNCQNSWFADPFILDVTDDRIIILVEEYYYPISRGRISKLIVDKSTFELKNKETVLELFTHLSFPAILRDNNRIFIYPENSASGKLTMYEYDIKQNTCTPYKTLSTNPLTDAIITDLLEEPCILSTQLPQPNSDILGKYICGELKETYKFNSKIARNAGDWFKYKGKIYRPAQDCNNTYGGAVILQEVVLNKSGNLEFKNIRHIESDYPKYKEGLHTFNSYKDIIVVDAKGFRHPIAHKIYNCIYRFKKVITTF